MGDEPGGQALLLGKSKIQRFFSCYQRHTQGRLQANWVRLPIPPPRHLICTSPGSLATDCNPVRSEGGTHGVLQLVPPVRTVCCLLSDNSRVQVSGVTPYAILLPMTRVHLPLNAQGSRALVMRNLTEHDTALDALEIKTKYMLALINRIHMEVDFEDLLALAPLAGGATQGAANTRAEVLRTALLEHMDGVGTIYVDGEHLAAETSVSSTLTAIPAATEINSCITLVNGLLAAVIAHGDSSGKHFHNDTGAGGTGATMTNNPPTTLGHLITDLNELKIAIQTHMSAGAV